MHSLVIVQWNSIRRDHPGNPGGVSGSGLVISSPKKIYPLEDSEYLMKIHFFPLGPSFSYS